jgi:transcriptional regulator NrdR family protein
MPMTTLEVTKADGTSVKFSSAKDQVVQGLTADMASGTLTIEALESSASKVAETQLQREQSAAQTLLDLLMR